jgi:hypothetical protein
MPEVFIESHIAVHDLQQELQWTLRPHMQAPHAGSFDHHGVVQIAKCHVLQPRHQKSSADGMRLYAIFPDRSMT